MGRCRKDEEETRFISLNEDHTGPLYKIRVRGGGGATYITPLLFMAHSALHFLSKSQSHHITSIVDIAAASHKFQIMFQ